MIEEDREPYAYEYSHKNGTDCIVTRAHGGNTYIGKEANDLMFEMFSRQRNLGFADIEFNNHLLIELNKRDDWYRSNRYVLQPI